jgi:hypothetical protein
MVVLKTLQQINVIHAKTTVSLVPLSPVTVPHVQQMDSTSTTTHVS